ncbi:uncharacterized protein CTHT_0074250 [Thermochaetoides thermophila DSM 1495]|uniref:Non-homologous end-joining factor 1 n=1 Tax=Chaetomium thermophilum (strain DSM 1495 / CBS 144.50 / IMI 039719) TaxID=759272 RepID=G0SI26_CHATD|nr:hypothetical protein CTHT_0074250 [Thermochaetoides thermophila DSM 1495]EGS17096.1 hypothetical protein CTHT_0074250 [Thermochaetoides thermophila DSM 1495]
MIAQPLWRQLPATAPGIPALLVSTTFGHDSYSIHVTDLANVWVESLERRHIIGRAYTTGSSIDPCDGPDQFRKLLELIGAAFDANDKDHPNISMTLTRGADDSLEIEIICVLPRPLEPFKWPMVLKKCPQSTLASELVLPLIQAQESHAREIDQLCSLIHEKDVVINRLVDKLEAAGIGLEHVFYALSGKRRVSRSVAESKVGGLVRFNEAEFREKASQSQSESGPGDVSSLLRSVFGTKGLQYKSNMDLEASLVLNDWWTKFSRGRRITLSKLEQQQQTTAPPLQREPTPPKDKDDDFQVHTTPSRRDQTQEPPSRKRVSLARPTTADDDETASSGDDETSEPPRSAKALTPSRDRLGPIGGKKPPSPSPPPPAESQKSTSSKTMAIGGDSETDSGTASEPDNDAMDTSPPKSPPRPQPRRGMLGQIGGKPKPTPAPEPRRSPTLTASAPQASPAPKRHKLGVIGKKAASPTSEDRGASTSDDDRGRSKDPVAENRGEERPRETSQERADRKRAELEKNLKKKATAGPVKKKRKF